MKNKFKTLSASLIVAMLAFSATVVPVFATFDDSDGDKLTEEQRISGQEEGLVEVKGTLGQKIDNTDPNAPITEEDKAWINVTIPTGIMFKVTKAAVGSNDNVEAPKYTITNHSARGVDVSVKKFEAKSAEEATTMNGAKLTLKTEIPAVTSPAINPAAKTNTEDVVLRTAENAFLSTTPVKIFTLMPGTDDANKTVKKENMKDIGKITKNKGHGVIKMGGVVPSTLIPASTTDAKNVKYEITLSFKARSLEKSLWSEISVAEPA